MQTCTRCIYDEHIPAISFDENGVCNYCHQFDNLEREYPTGKQGWEILKGIAEEIKKRGRNKPFDLVVGVSGGCDSSYMLYLAKEKLGLRPLAVHFDNTWDSKIAVENIYRVTKSLDVELFTYVVDNKEYNDIYKSFFQASVPEIDTPADIGLATTLYIGARKHGIKSIFEGHSFRTEGISPPGWFYMDAKYIHSIQKQFGHYRLNSFPNLWFGRWMKWSVIDRIKKYRPLYYIDYNKEDVKRMLSKEFGWQWYGGHHMENRSAYFTNNYYLPKKFNIDLRYCEFSALIRSGQMDRDEALEKIKEEKPFDHDILEEVMKRLGFSEKEFEEIMNASRKTFLDYKTYKSLFEKLRPFFWILANMNLVPMSFYLKYTKKYTDEELENILGERRFVDGRPKEKKAA